MELKKFKSAFKYKAVIFDLDNTIYDETEFLFSSYTAIGNYIANKSGRNTKIYEQYLINSYIRDGRSNLFDKLISDFRLQNLIKIDELLSILRNHQTRLTFNKNALSIIEGLIIRKIAIFILTNGNAIQQKNKISGLNILQLFPQIKIYYAIEYEPKPSPYCVNKIINDYKICNSGIVLIGDSEIDRKTAENSNIDFINISNYEIE